MSGLAMTQLHSPELRMATISANARATLDSEFEAALAPFGKQTLIRRVMEGVLTQPKLDLQGILAIVAHGVGGEDKGKIEAVLAPKRAELRQLAEKRADALRQMSVASTPEQMRTATARAHAIQTEMQAAMQELAVTVETAGIATRNPLDDGQMSQLIDLSNRMENKAERTPELLAREFHGTEALLHMLASDPKASARLGPDALIAAENLQFMLETQRTAAKKAGKSIGEYLASDDPDMEHIHWMKRSELRDIRKSGLNSNGFGAITNDQKALLTEVATRHGTSLTYLLSQAAKGEGGMQTVRDILRDSTMSPREQQEVVTALTAVAEEENQLTKEWQTDSVKKMLKYPGAVTTGEQAGTAAQTGTMHVKPDKMYVTVDKLVVSTDDGIGGTMKSEGRATP